MGRGLYVVLHRIQHDVDDRRPCYVSGLANLRLLSAHSYVPSQIVASTHLETNSLETN